MIECVWTLRCRRRERKPTRSAKARAVVLIIATCTLLSVFSITGVYQIKETKTIMKYYQTVIYGDKDIVTGRDTTSGSTGSVASTGSKYDDDDEGNSTTSNNDATIDFASNERHEHSFPFDEESSSSSLSSSLPLLDHNTNTTSIISIQLRTHTIDTTTNSSTTATTATAATTTGSNNNNDGNDTENDLFYPIERPTNLRLAIMGDSISRYQYISLVYFLQTGTWITNDTKMTLPFLPSNSNDTPLHCKTPGIRAREQFYTISHSFLKPNEILCDGRAYSENRYYIDTQRNNSITYITKFGKNKTSGRYLPKQIYANMKNRGERKKDAWIYKYWNETIHYHIAQLKPKPQYLLFNAGLHKHDLHSQSIRQGILDATKRHDIIPIYKTTTYPNNRSIGLHDFALADHDSLLCGKQSDDVTTVRAKVPFCLDMSWTSQLYGDEHYYDYYHLKPYWNYYMNLQTLLYVELIESQRKSNSNMKNVPAVFRSDNVERRLHDGSNQYSS